MKIDTIFWDFDGVLMDSMSVRDEGFREVLKGYSKSKVDTFITYHQENGGLSRYHKFRYFYEQILGEKITEEQVNELAQQFSAIMKRLLTEPELLIQETWTIVKQNQIRSLQYIVSGSDQKELRYLNSQFDTDKLFQGIYGSPTPKVDLVKMILSLEQVERKNACLIGDSINDKHAAEVNGITFIPYNFNNV